MRLGVLSSGSRAIYPSADGAPFAVGCSARFAEHGNRSAVGALRAGDRVVCALAAVYGGQYLLPYAKQKNLGLSWFFFNLLAASMLLVVVARNGVLFLVTWELMSLASFFLVMFEGEQESVRRAGWTYLVAMHLGTAFLIAMFVVLGSEANSLDFDKFPLASGAANLAFLLAVIGFGTKAGFIPMHVWLPEAHPAAPSHVSAVMSGVMIKTGIYGLLRMLTLLGAPPAVVGLDVGGHRRRLGHPGRALRLAQHDLKRLLAYCSVENIGIIALGLGVGLLGISYHNSGHGGLRFRRRTAARRQPCRLQEPAVSRRGSGAARHRHTRYRPPGRTVQTDAGHRRDFPASARRRSAGCRR